MAGKVKVITQGRYGTIQYSEKGQTCKFDWEIIGGDIITTVWFPTEAQWNTKYLWAEGRRQEILDAVAKEAQRQGGESSTIKWEADRLHVMAG